MWAPDVENRTIARAAALGFHDPRVSPARRAAAPHGHRLDVGAARTALTEVLGRRAHVEELRPLLARRPVALVRTPAGGTFLIKAAAGADDDGVRHEWTRLRTVWEMAPQRLRDHIPEPVGFTSPGVLVTTGVPGSRTLMALGEQQRSEWQTWLSSLAELLAVLHAIELPSGVPVADDLRLRLPLTPIEDLTPTELAWGVGRDYPHYVAAVQAIGAELEEVAAAWGGRALVHADLHLANVLCSASGRLVLVDWELAGYGDPFYDAATVVAQLIHGALSAAGPDFGSRLREVAHFFDAYAAGAALSADEVVRIARMSGVTLLLVVRGRLERFGTLGASGELALRTAQRLLVDPEQFLGAMSRVLAGSAA